MPPTVSGPSSPTPSTDTDFYPTTEFIPPLTKQEAASQWMSVSCSIRGMCRYALFGVEHIRAQRSYFAFEFAFLDGKFIAVNAVGVSAVG